MDKDKKLYTSKHLKPDTCNLTPFFFTHLWFFQQSRWQFGIENREQGLLVDFPENVRILPLKNSYTTASLSDSKLAFSYCPLDEAIALLDGQYAMGTVEVRMIN